MSKFPEMVQCLNSSCGNFFSLFKHSCNKCNFDNFISNIVRKARPVILWIDKQSWYNSMAFGIPLSKTKLIDNRFNHTIRLEDYVYTHQNSKYHVPMRAIIHQATRIDGNTCRSNQIIGKITNNTLKSSIENKLVDWIFQ